MSPIHALESLPSNAPRIDLQFEEGMEPLWACTLLSLPGKMLNSRKEHPDVTEPSFVLTQHGEEGFELAYSEGARFVVDGSAKRVWGTFRPPLTKADLEVFLFGSVMGFLLRRRGVTCLHSSSVEFQGHAVCLCGSAGSGKSTTAAALALRGYPVVAEDIVALEQTPHRFLAVSGYPQVCLWPESVQMLLGSAEALPLISPAWEQRHLPLDGRRAKFAAGKLPVGLVYVFADRVNDPGSPRIEKLGAREAVLQLVQNTYMNWLLSREQRATELETLCQLVERVSVRRIIPHARPEKLPELCDLIVRDAEECLAARVNSKGSNHS